MIGGLGKAPTLRAFAFGFAALAVACSDESSSRALRDLEVGHVEIDGTRFDVADGLAAFHVATPGRIVLWASVPTFRVSVSAPASGSFSVEVRNAMPAAEATVESGVGITIAHVDEPSTVPTRRSFDLELDPGAAGTLRFGPPDSEEPRAFRFALLSDVQDAVDGVQDLFAPISAEDVDFLLGAGDLTENGRPSQHEHFQTELLSLDVPYFTTLGNHELYTPDVPFLAYHGRANVHFAHHGVYFTLLDSGSATIAPEVYGWLEAWLAAAGGSVHVVGMHIPPLDPTGVRNGAFASRHEAAKLLGMLAGGGVDLTVYGHVHTHVAFDNAGIPAFISGGGGAWPEKFDAIGRHYMVFDVDPVEGVTGHRTVAVDSD